MQTGSCMNRRGYKVRANLRPAIFLLHWPTVRWGGRQILTQFANFGALALATTGQHERWPDYAVSVHNWHLLNMRNFQFYMNVKNSQVLPSPFSQLYMMRLWQFVCFFVNGLLKAVTAINFPAPSTSNDNETQIHEKASNELRFVRCNSLDWPIWWRSHNFEVPAL